MRNTGTIMVSMDSGIPVRAMNPNVQIRQKQTQVMGNNSI